MRRVPPNLFYVSPPNEKLPSPPLDRLKKKSFAQNPLKGNPGCFETSLFQDLFCVQVAFTAPNSSIAILALHKWLRETQERLEVKGEACLGRTTAIVTSERNLQASPKDIQLRSLQC